MVVDSYDEELTHAIQTSLQYGAPDLAATTVGNYALFGGGGSGSLYRAGVFVYQVS